jgi:two-component system chemotaxis response regulator CheY
MILKKVVLETGFEVAEAADGHEAITRLNRGEQADLLLVDWNMPVMNGYELICAVRANSLLSGMRIMMVTTETSMSQVEQALKAGADEYLMKPFTKDVLLTKLALVGLK